MSLDVYLNGRLVGGLFPAAACNYSFAYLPEIVAERDGTARWQASQVSQALPLRREPFGPDVSRAFIEGLLPQGHRRELIAAELGLDPRDGYGLIAELGGDCPGAVTFLRAGEEPPPRPEPGALAWAGEDELEDLLSPWPNRVFDPACERQMRFALPGARPKLALVRDEASGRWAWPEPGVPSTHVIKPESPDRPGLVTNEAICALAYRELGLPVAHTAVEEIAGVPCLVSKRFDRWGEGVGAERLHQESFSQALSVIPGRRRRYGETPNLRESCGLLRAVGEADGAETLRRTALCDLIIGNTAARGANASLLLNGGRPILAPFYSVASTEIYGEERRREPVIGAPPAPFIVDVFRTAEEFELEFQPTLIEAVKALAPTCSSLNDALERAHAEGWWSEVAEGALQTAMDRTKGLQDEMTYISP